MINHEYDKHQRADAPLGALSPGSSAARQTSAEAAAAEFGAVEIPHVEPSEANPEALIEGNRVTTARDMERRDA